MSRKYLSVTSIYSACNHARYVCRVISDDIIEVYNPKNGMYKYYTLQAGAYILSMTYSKSLFE